MATYQICVIRTETREKIINIEAESLEDAEKAAKAKAHLIDFRSGATSRDDFEVIPVVDLPPECLGGS